MSECVDLVLLVEGSWLFRHYDREGSSFDELLENNLRRYHRLVALNVLDTEIHKEEATHREIVVKHVTKVFNRSLLNLRAELSRATL